MTVATPRNRVALSPLLEAGPAPGPQRGGDLPPALAARYGGQLSIPLHADRPTVVANFVTTLDGAVSYATPEAAGGGEISGFNEADRFVMGLLRSLSDAVLIGAGTLRAAPTEAWTPDFVHPDGAPDFLHLRGQLGLRPQPITTVVTASGRLDLDHPGLTDAGADVLILTTDAGAAELAAQRARGHVDVVAAGERLDPVAIVRALEERGARLVLCEGGPHLLAQLLRDRLLDELFLTMAPQIAGRSEATPRLALAEGVAFEAATAPWSRLVDVRRADDHLFMRYRFSAGGSR